MRQLHHNDLAVVGSHVYVLTTVQFSAGARTCIGRHIAILETCKLIPALLRRFRLELAEPDKEWEIVNYTFLKPKAVNVYFVRRE
jgi:cytochrome P450